ncbi:MAG: B12-binding domain-containing radical SAM protein [Desulfomonilaceae bacterium]
MRVLLINANLRHDLFAAAPIGLCFVASAAKAAGHEVRVLDLCFVRTPFNKIQSVCRSFAPDVVGLSVRNIDNVNMLHPVSYVRDARSIADWIRQCTDAPLVVGGSGASLLPRELLAMLKADYVVVSDGEASFVKLLDSLSKGENAPKIPGVGYQKNGSFVMTPPLLGAFPVARPHVDSWIDFSGYDNLGAGYSIQSYRGCSHRCIYCLYPSKLQGNAIRRRDPKEVVDEIEEVLFRLRPKSFEFVDSLFNEPIDHCISVLEEIVRRPWQAIFSATSLSPKKIDQRFLSLLWRAGFRSFHVSPESALPDMIAEYGKPFCYDDVRRAAEAIAESSFKVLWFFMIGGPGENARTLQETLDFCAAHLRNEGKRCTQVANVMLGVRLYPETQLWEIAQRQGYVSPRSDPLEQLWYLSPELDIGRTIRQLVKAALSMPEIISGMDERFMRFSHVMSAVARLVGLKSGYWSLIFHANRWLRRSLLPLVFDTQKIIDSVELQLSAHRPVDICMND